MTKSCALIWDMDGTLVDSYPAIVPAAKEVCDSLGCCYSAEEIHEKVIRTSVGTLLEEIAFARGLDPQPVIRQFNILNDRNIKAITAIPHAKETLKALCLAGHRNFVYTHRGASCVEILSRNGLTPYFTEILTALSGFPRKPEPDAILYLIKKYCLDKQHTYYVGDRRLDIDVANNAEIGSVLYLVPESPVIPDGTETAVIHDLSEIPMLLR